MTIVYRWIPVLILLIATLLPHGASAIPYPDEPQLPQDKPVINPYSGWKAEEERVVIIHDLFEMSVDTSTMASAFRQAGFKVDNLGYNPLGVDKAYILPAMVDAIYQRIRSYTDKGDVPVHFVCYELGCVIMHGILFEHPPKRLGNVLMIAAPAYAAWLTKGHDVVSWGLQHPRLEGANKRYLQDYLAAPLSYQAAGLTGTHMTYTRETATIFDLQGKPHDEKQVRVPAVTTPVTLRIVPGDQKALRTHPDITAQAVHYIREGRF